MHKVIHKSAVFCAVVLAMLSANCFAAATVKVTMTDNSIQLDTATAKAGKVTFDVTNHASKLMHEMVVLKTDLTDDKLPVKGPKVEENKLKNMGEAHDMKPGKSRKLTLNMKPGHYVLICNIDGHYAMGMHTNFTVEP